MQFSFVVVIPQRLKFTSILMDLLCVYGFRCELITRPEESYLLWCVGV